MFHSFIFIVIVFLEGFLKSEWINEGFLVYYSAFNLCFYLLLYIVNVTINQIFLSYYFTLRFLCRM